MSLTVAPGEIHALVGENGAGKSTLVKIVAGIQAPDSGLVEVTGAPVTRFTPAAARRAGVALVAQEPEHFGDLTALENLFVGHWELGPGRTIRWAEMERRASELLGRLGMSVPLHARMGSLSYAERQVVQIGRALLLDASVLILDEPTAALGQAETEALFALVKRLAVRGVAVVYISHRLEEIFELAQIVTVLRDGALVTTQPVAALTRDDLVRSMVGSAVSHHVRDARAQAAGAETGEPVLEVDALSSPGRFSGVSFQLAPGEILGVAGLAGSGRDDLAHALGGAVPTAVGRVLVSGREVRLRGPGAARRAGLVLAPGDRQGKALILPLSVRENVTLSVLAELASGPFTSRRKEAAVADQYASSLDVRAASIEQPTATLSGGNQQKVSLARRLATRPRVLVLEEPTQGVDVGARAEIHKLLRGLAAQGLAVLLVSSDLDELLALSDRVLVMHRGSVAGTVELPAAPDIAAIKAEILGLAFGAGEGPSSRAAPGSGRTDLVGSGLGGPHPGPLPGEEGEAVPSPPSPLPRERGARVRRGRGEGGRHLPRELGLAGFLVVACLALTIARPQFMSVGSIKDMMVNSSDVLVSALGMMMIILTAGIDISIASMLALCCMVSGQLAVSHAALPLVILGTLGAGLILGGFNGVGVSAMRLPPIIMTLATLTMYRGMVVSIGGGRWISDLPDSFHWLGHGWMPVVTATAVTGVVAWVLRMTSFGRGLYAVGNNPTASQHLGISVRRVQALVYTVGGLVIGLAALVFAPQLASIQMIPREGYEMRVITAVVVGGTNIFGGRGTVLGTVLGVALLTVIGSGLNLLGVSGHWDRALQGALVLLAVTTDYLRTRAERRGGGEE